MQRRLIALALGGVALLSACGGGGDSGNSGFTPPSGDFAALTGYQQLMGNGRSWSVSGTGSNGLGYSATFAFAAAAADVYPITGASLSRTILTSSTRQGSNPPENVTAEFFHDTDFRILGARYAVGTGAPVCSRVAGTPSLPQAAAKVNASGALVTLDDLAGCTPSSASVGSTVTTWSLAFDRGIVLLCLDTVARNTANAVIGSESDCVGINEAGALGNAARITITQPGGFSLVMRNYP